MLDRKDIWLVSEYRQLLGSLDKLLSANGYNVRQFHSSGAVVEEINDTARKPHLIISDTIDGVDDILNHARKANVPVIVQEAMGIDIESPNKSNSFFLKAIADKIKQHESKELATGAGGYGR